VCGGSLSIYKKATEGDEALYAILDRTNRLSIHDTLVHTAPIPVFITRDLAFYAAVVGKEGMDKAVGVNIRSTEGLKLVGYFYCE
jgi:hypothetical protein